ncbi:MAG: RluA family pseudouridine synthase [Anaerolineales bacterium]|nr:RluA family pseudouridine synthase [Anaerolineales bacterium]
MITPPRSEVKRYNSKMNLIYQDESVLLVNKPANLSVLAEGWNKDAPYLVKILEEQYSKIWVVHRLDKITSGIIVFALNADAHRSLSVQFEKHQVEKKYQALMNGVPKWDEKTTKFPLRINVGRRHRTVVDDRDGIRSETRFKILERYPLSARVEAAPLTGRTHQIRVHAAALGHPLAGDALYGAPPTKAIARPALHAEQLTFAHPVTNERVSFRADLPDDFQNALKLLRTV